MIKYASPALAEKAKLVFGKTVNAQRRRVTRVSVGEFLKKLDSLQRQGRRSKLHLG